jgi:diguanylate cyclase (GGDEF)-like protein
MPAAFVWAVVAAAANAPARAEVDALGEPRIESVGVGAIARGVASVIAMDRAGFMWVGTGDGLVRYDGHKFRPQGRVGKDVLSQNLGLVRALLPTPDGRLWIGTESDGLAVYDPRTETVELQPLTDANAAEAPTVRALAEDAGGAIWVGTMGLGLMRLDPATGRVTQYRQSDPVGGLADDRVMALLVDRRGDLWAGSWKGLNRRRAGAERFEPVPMRGADQAAVAGDDVVSSLFEASDRRIWVGTQGGHLTIVDPSGAPALGLEVAGDTSTAPRGAIASMVEAPGGVVWVGSATGVELRRLADGRLHQRLRHKPGRAGGLAANDVHSLMVDRAGWIWLSGMGVGLQRHNPNNQAMRVLRAAPQVGTPPVELTDLRSVLALPSGEVWVSTVDNGVIVMDAAMHVTALLRVPAVDKATAGAPPGHADTAQVDAMARAADGTTWLGSEAGVHQFDTSRRLLRSLRHGSGSTNRLLPDNDGGLWVGTEDGLYHLAPAGRQLVRVAQRGGKALTGDVFALALASDGDLWVGTERGLLRVPRGEADLVAVDSAVSAGLGNPAVISLLFDSKQVLWLDTAVAGLHRMSSWNGKTASFERISERHGAAGHPFGCNLMEDERGRIWTHQFVYDPSADRLTALTVADGVDFGTGWYRAYAKAADGRLLIGGTRGLLVVTPALYDRPSYVPPIVVSELRIDGQRVPAGRLATEGLTLSPDKHSFSIEFATLDYSDTDYRRYAHQLDGEDPDWIATNADFRIATYGRPGSGHHLLRVRGNNRDGQWMPRDLVVDVEVQPAWWQNAWAVLAALMGATAFVLVLVHLRTRWMRLRQQLLERMVRERTAELDSMSQALQRKSKELEQASLTDPLTGLRNRRFLAENIEHDLALSARRHEAHLSRGTTLDDTADLIFFLIDIDHFKQVNDEFGHDAGDTVLVQLCQRLHHVFRDSDYLVRWGGEEFLIVARGTSRDHAAELAERARVVVADQPFALADGTPVSKTCSIGFVCFPPAPAFARALDWSSLVKLADTALYAVKQRGRNGWLGVLQAHADTPEALRTWALKPSHEWLVSGDLQLVASNGVVLASTTAAAVAAAATATPHD